MKKQIERILATDASLAPTILRITLGSVMFAHGSQKALGWFGGYGFEGTMGFFTGAMGLPSIVAVLIIAIEFIGAIALIVGAGGRLAALASGAIMVGAIAMVHGEHGFFMNWSGSQAGEGFEFHLLIIGLSAGVALMGSGAYSVDRWLLRSLNAQESKHRGEPLAAAA